MRLKKIWISGCVAFVGIVLPVALPAQTSSINAFSPYSMYGIGELREQGALPTRSMGGAGVAMRSLSTVNLLNPAALSIMEPKTFMFDLGVEGENFYNSQRNGGELLKTSYNTFNFHEIAIQMPITRKLGVGFSLSPYSSVGYRMTGTIEDDEIWGSIGRVQQHYSGEGDVTMVKAGIGWEVFKNFSIGVAGIYYWGDLTRSYITSVSDNYVGGGNFSPIIGEDNYSISNIKGQVGIQWNLYHNREKRRTFTFGATYDIGGDMNPDITKRVYVGDMFSTTAKSDATYQKLVLPHQLAGGFYFKTPKVALAADYVYQNWGGSNSVVETAVSGFSVAYRDTHTIKMGVEWTPNRMDVRNVLKRWSYRVGFRYGNYYQSFGGQQLNQYSITAGIGIPLRVMGISAIDIGVEYGSRGNRQMINERVGLVKQNFFKFSIGISMFGEDYWFFRPKYD